MKSTFLQTSLTMRTKLVKLFTALASGLCFCSVTFPACARADATNQQLLDALNAINQNIYQIYTEGLYSVPWTVDPTMGGEYLWQAMTPWLQSLAYDLHGTASSTQGASLPGSVRYLLQSIANKPGSAWTTNDIARLLSAVNAARSPWTTNDVASVRSDVSDLLTLFNSDLQGWSDSNHNPALSVKDYDLVNLLGFVYQTYDMEGDASLRVHDQDAYDVLSSIQSAVGNDIENYLRAVIEAIEESGADISGNLHDAFGGMSNIVNLAAVEDALSVLVPSVTNSEEYARLIHDEDLGYANSDGSRTLAGDLSNLLAFITNNLAEPQTTNALNSWVASHDGAEDVMDTSDGSNTNSIPDLEISKPQFSDMGDILEIGENVDDWFPDITGDGDGRIVLFSGGRYGDITVDQVYADLSLKPEHRAIIRQVSKWLWRLLLLCGMFAIVREEFTYWTTLGGSAG